MDPRKEEVRNRDGQSLDLGVEEVKLTEETGQTSLTTDDDIVVVVEVSEIGGVFGKPENGNLKRERVEKGGRENEGKSEKILRGNRGSEEKRRRKRGKAVWKCPPDKAKATQTQLTPTAIYNFLIFSTNIIVITFFFSFFSFIYY